MSKWVDADALIMALRLEYPMMPMFKENQKEWGVKTEGYRKAEEVIKEAPSIDIVRCGECKYKRINEDGETRYYYCALEDRPNRQWSVDDTDYCSWGERDE